MNFFGACKYGDFELVKTLSEQFQDWDLGMCCACLRGHMNIVTLMIEKGANNWNTGMVSACLGEHMDIVKLMIQKGANNWNDGMVSACRTGYIDIVKFMIQKGADDWNDGMIQACWAGYIDIVKFMIQKGRSSSSAKPADDWNDGMIHACWGGNIKIVKLMISERQKSGEKGAITLKLNEDLKKKLVYSLSFSELKKYMKIVPFDVKKMIQKRLYFFFQVYTNIFGSNNMFPVLVKK